MAGTAFAQPISLSLEEAVQIALERNYTIRAAELDVETARAQIGEAYGSLFPRVDLSSSYTRNVISPNPFAGSDAGSLFGGLGSIDWLAFNEEARTDDDPTTEPIPLQEFRDRQQAGLDAAGIVQSTSDNPFSVPNSFQNTVSVSQTLYNGSAFAAVRGARSLRNLNEAALDQRRHEVIHQTRQLFYGALLAQEQVDVLESSVERTRETVDETTLLVAQGVAPKLQRLQVEVQLANQETQLIQARTAANGAKDQLLFTLGLPVDQQLTLRGSLDVSDRAPYRTVGLLDAVSTALNERPDLEQARINIELQEVNKGITASSYFPSVSAFANLGYSGNVPDDRTVVSQTGDFEYEASENGFFDDSYWDPSVAVGISLNWTIFDGLQRRRRVQQNTIAVEQAEIQYERAQEGAKLEVAQTIRELEGAEQRVAAQRQTVSTAQLAYDFAFERLRNGAGTQLDVRQASDNLDQSRLLHLQAIHDYLVALSDLERATGTIDIASDLSD
ncbi:MAG: TolC family protein [Rubricoccaceae bacterium]|nr:TolC family protein [Rubricoccaceae bacterium]